MSAHADHGAVPSGVDEQSAALLRRAYALASPDDGQRLYTDWAETYDATMLQGLGYVSPRLVAEALGRHVAADHSAGDSAGQRPVLDIGCGTGLVGKEAAVLGFHCLDGLDLSAAMMSVAAGRGIYRHLLAADLTQPLPIADGEYAAVVSAGTFTSGHVDASCLPELVRVLAPGGCLVCTVHNAVWEPLGFAAGFAKLVAAGRLVSLEDSAVGYYETSSDDGRLLVFRRLP